MSSGYSSGQEVSMDEYNLEIAKKAAYCVRCLGCTSCYNCNNNNYNSP